MKVAVSASGAVSAGDLLPAGVQCCMCVLYMRVPHPEAESHAALLAPDTFGVLSAEAGFCKERPPVGRVCPDSLGEHEGIYSLPTKSVHTSHVCFQVESRCSCLRCQSPRRWEYGTRKIFSRRFVAMVIFICSLKI